MFTNITWKDFFECIIFLSLAYYFVIALKYNREIKQWLQAKKLFAGSPAVSLQTNLFSERDEPTGDAQTIYSSCIDEISAFFEEAKASKWIKEEMLYSLQRTFKKYQSLKNSPEKTAVEYIVSTLSREECSIDLYENDFKRLWLGQ